MRRWAYSLCMLVLSVWTVRAVETILDQTNARQCAGMYSKFTWPGPVDPYISVKFINADKVEGKDPVVSVLIWEWEDTKYVTDIDLDEERGRYEFDVCTKQAVDAKLCKEADVGKFILQPDYTNSTSAIANEAYHLNGSQPIKYKIKNTGYYCVVTEPYTTENYQAVLEFRNSYGELQAAQIPKLSFYGGITILYALVLVFWGFLYYQYRSDILAVQNYITAILIFLVIEMLLTWGFFDYRNRHGSNIGAKVFLVVVGVLNAARNSFSFFLLLIVCMGYGVVKHTLGKTMIYVRWLAIVHFVFGILYSVTYLIVTPDDAGIFLLFVVLPLAGTLTAFYVWTLNSLNLTLKDLKERKQHVKESMYKKLWWCILISIMVVFGFFFFNSFSFASVSDMDYVADHWKTRWFILDGWPNLVYFADVAWVAYVWRPTANNRRFAMSDEIAQEDDGTFEIANLDIGNPDESDDDEERAIGSKTTQNGATAAAPTAASPAGPAVGASVSAPTRQPSQSQQQQNRPRESLDGETIFAVGEDGDKFSDDESGEESGLVGRARK